MPPEIVLSGAGLTRTGAEAIVLPVADTFAGYAPFQALAAAIGGTRLIDTIAKRDFKAKKGSTLELDLGPGASPAAYVVLYGLGANPAPTAEELLELAGGAVRRARAAFARSTAILLDPALLGDEVWAAHYLGLGADLGAYVFDKYLTKNPPKTPVDKITLVTAGGAVSAELERSLASARVRAGGVRLARDLVNEPPDVASPEFLAQTALKIADESGGLITATVLHPRQIQDLKMNLYWAVARGATLAPRFIRLDYTPAGFTGERRPLTIIGKGLTFDSGGLSLKPTEGMVTMKCDMSGAAAVLGTFSTLAALKPAYPVTGLIAACENAIDGGSYRNGDIIEGMPLDPAGRGITVEIHNTDAEGRLTLADALTYAQREANAAKIVDLATLTGACVVGLGDFTFGAMANNASFGAQILDAAKAAGEDAHPLPLHPKLRKQLDSKYADLKNVGGRAGGAITAGLFLKEFVRDDVPWVHLDIAGPAFGDEERGHISKGGSGVGVLTLTEWLTSATP